jgi:phosphatidylglycerol lysyltransferase
MIQAKVRLAKNDTSRHSQIVLRLVVLGVALNGLLIIAGTLLDNFFIHGRDRDLSALFGIPLISGITLIYLSSLLARRKRTAWVVSVPVYASILVLNLAQILVFSTDRHFALMGLVRNILFPALIIASLIYYRDEFMVKSDIASFRQSLRFIVIILVVTFFYGVAGFMLMDNHDFHQEISLGGAMQRTVDQFGLTTNHALVPYTRRARIFVDSLSVISIGALAYAAASLFQPLKARFNDQSQNRERMRALLASHTASSEDYFKLWPEDKSYFFSSTMTAALALRVYRGVALVVGDPAGQQSNLPSLLTEFQQLCYGNDWQPAFIHTESKFSQLYKDQGMSVQKIGEEAILDIRHFQEHVATNKYFRHIRNKFTKQGYTSELLSPPHSTALIGQLRAISKEWLAAPGRTERGFMMGYFSSDYMQRCDIMVVRDETSKIKAFINQIPSFDEREANFDLLRHTQESLGNVNDFLLMSFIDHTAGQGFERLNLGLCPLTGLDKKQADSSLIDNALRFAYANGDRLYSFSGLRRFKAKYEPEWSSRYVAYKGGIRGFTRTLGALNRAMKVKKHQVIPR